MHLTRVRERAEELRVQRGGDSRANRATRGGRKGTRDRHCTSFEHFSRWLLLYGIQGEKRLYIFKPIRILHV